MDTLVAITVLLIGLFPILVSLVRRIWFAKILIVACTVRIFTALFHNYIQALPQGSADAVSFDRVAVAWANQYGCSSFFEHFNPSTSYVYSSFLALFYGCVEYSPLAVLFMNVVLGTYGILFLILSCKLLWGNKEAIRIGWILAFFPFLIIFSSVGLRESFIFCFFNFGIYSFLRYSTDQKLIWLIISFMALYFSSLFHGAMNLAIVGILIGITIKPVFRKTVRSDIYIQRIFRLLILSILISIALGFIYQNMSIHKLGNLSELDLEEIGLEASVRARGNAAYLTGLTPNSFVDLIWQAPIRLAYFCFSPFPWDVSSGSHLLGLIDGLFYLVMFSFLVKYRAYFLNRPEIVSLLIVLFILALAFSFGTSNFGTATRHRAKFLTVILVIVAPALFKIWRRNCIKDLQIVNTTT